MLPQKLFIHRSWNFVLKYFSHFLNGSHYGFLSFSLENDKIECSFYVFRNIRPTKKCVFKTLKILDVLNVE